MQLNNQFRHVRASLSLIWLIRQQHDKVSPRSLQKHARCCHGFSERFVCVCVCMHVEGCLMGACVDVEGGNYRELVPNVSVKLIRRK